MSKVMDAIQALVPGAECAVRGEETIIWEDDRTQPTQEEIDAEIAKQKTKYVAQEYARNRQTDYPDWGSQLNKIYEDGIDKWKTEMVDPVKAKWPKDNSGPK